MRVPISAGMAFAVFFLAFDAQPLNASVKESETEAKKAEVIEQARRTFEKMMLAWRDEDYPALYAFGTLRSRKRLSREDFKSRMQMAKKRLQCCWATFRDVTAIYKSPKRVYIEATIGYRDRTPVTLRPRRSLQPVEDSFFEHETFFLVFEHGGWRVNLFRILEKGSK